MYIHGMLQKSCNTEVCTGSTFYTQKRFLTSTFCGLATVCGFCAVLGAGIWRRTAAFGARLVPDATRWLWADPVLFWPVLCIVHGVGGRVIEDKGSPQTKLLFLGR